MAHPECPFCGRPADATTRDLTSVLDARGYRLTLVRDRSGSGGPSWAYWAL